MHLVYFYFLLLLSTKLSREVTLLFNMLITFKTPVSPFVNCASFISIGELVLNRILTSPRYERTINMSTHILVRDYHTSDLFNVCDSIGIIWIEIVYHKHRKESLQWQQYINDVKTLSNKAIILPADTFTGIVFLCYGVISPVFSLFKMQAIINFIHARQIRH